MDNGDFIAGVPRERNTGFHILMGGIPISDRDTIAAYVHSTQTIPGEQALRVHLLEAVAADDHLIPRGTVLTSGTRIQGERMDIAITNMKYWGTVILVELEVYDAGDQRGILIPNSLGHDAVRGIAAGIGGSIGSSISISTGAGAQTTLDLGKGVIQSVPQHIIKKIRTVKVALKARHRPLLHSPKRWNGIRTRKQKPVIQQITNNNRTWERF